MVIYFGNSFVRDSNVSNLLKHHTWLPKVLTYGCGVFLILIGMLQVLACWTENRCLILMVCRRLPICLVRDLRRDHPAADCRLRHRVLGPQGQVHRES